MRRCSNVIAAIGGASLVAALVTACAGTASGSEPANTDPKAGWVEVNTPRLPNGHDGPTINEMCDPNNPGVLWMYKEMGTVTFSAVSNVQACL